MRNSLQMSQQYSSSSPWKLEIGPSSDLTGSSAKQKEEAKKVQKLDALKPVKEETKKKNKKADRKLLPEEGRNLKLQPEVF